MSICASLDGAATGRGRGGLLKCGFQGKMIDDALSCHIKKTISPCWRPAKKCRRGHGQTKSNESRKTNARISIQRVTVARSDTVEIPSLCFFSAAQFPSSLPPQRVQITPQ